MPWFKGGNNYAVFDYRDLLTERADLQRAFDGFKEAIGIDIDCGPKFQEYCADYAGHGKEAQGCFKAWWFCSRLMDVITDLVDKGV
jgi:hypothetical protein